MDLSLLREWAPIDDIISKIPLRWHRGMFASDICLTCVDVVPEFIALGTNAGFAIWYDRKKGTLDRLLCEEPTHYITEIKVVSSVEYMVACGADGGLISVFSIPKEVPLGVVRVEQKSSVPERYCIRDLHTSSISSLEWSKNGMKLFSGDKSGSVVLTEIDFYMHICKSVELLNESYEIVQLCYNHPKLLISTLFRTIITEKKDSKWEVLQVGRQDRKSLSKLGATFLPKSNVKEHSIIYNCRHGYRLWVAKHDGTVEKTLLFKDKLRKPKFIVPILNPKPKSGKDCIALQPELPNFGIIKPYGEYLLTYNEQVMYLLNPTGPQVLAVLKQFRNILFASTCDNEIFVLEGPRSLIRLSTAPDYLIINSESNISSVLTSSSLFSTLNSKLKIISNLAKPLEDKIEDCEVIVKAEECVELPPIEQLSPNDLIPLELKPDATINQNNLHDKLRIFDQINKQSYDENILYKSEIRKKRKGSVASLQELEHSGEINTSLSADEIVKSTCCEHIQHPKDIIAPDLRSPTSLLEDIKTKERKLAELLNLESIVVPQKEVNKSDDTDLKFLKDFQKALELPDISNEDFVSNTESLINYDHPKDKSKDEICTNFTENVETIQMDSETINKDKSLNISVEKNDIKIPIVKDIPGGWNLENIQIWKNNNVNKLDIFESGSSSDAIDSEWEIV